MGLRTFTFAGTASSTYNLFIVEAAPYNAPERAVEMIEIPGRNGFYALDKGGFENVELTYHVCVYDKDHTDFAGEISDVRNWLCSKVGYQRLTDDYNPNEYRMAVYKSGLESSEVFMNGAEFDLVFECKPQRFLTSGETAAAVASGGKVTNPTLFDARPQLQIWGYGSIDLGGQNITVNNVTIGNIQIANAVNATSTTLDVSSLNSGDSIFATGVSVDFYYIFSQSYYVKKITATGHTNCTSQAFKQNVVNLGRTMFLDDAIFTKGTAGSQTSTCSFNAEVYATGTGTTTTTAVTVSVVMAYDGDDTITLTVTQSPTLANVSFKSKGHLPDIFAESTKSALGNPLYIDLDIGECYNLDSGSAVSLNNAVSLPADLPTLPSGDTTITYDNTITQFKVVPRWWKV